VGAHEKKYRQVPKMVYVATKASNSLVGGNLSVQELGRGISSVSSAGLQVIMRRWHVLCPRAAKVADFAALLAENQYIGRLHVLMGDLNAVELVEADRNVVKGPKREGDVQIGLRIQVPADIGIGFLENQVFNSTERVRRVESGRSAVDGMHYSFEALIATA